MPFDTRDAEKQGKERRARGAAAAAAAARGLTDGGLTSHRGCPVREGEKWVATQWIREGVTEEEPFYLFNPVRGGRL